MMKQTPRKMRAITAVAASAALVATVALTCTSLVSSREPAQARAVHETHLLYAAHYYSAHSTVEFFSGLR